ncbi:MAG: glycosyltransferase family 87 protein [Gemmataceae bacterium]
MGLLCGGLALQNSLAHQQTDVLLAACQLSALGMLLRQRDVIAGGLLGLATAIKCTPLLWLPYLLWRGRVRAGSALVGVALGASLLPDLLVSAPSGSWLQEYARRVAAPRPMGVWGTDPIYNQSLAGTTLRWLAVDVERQHSGGLQTHFRSQTLDTTQHSLVVLLLIGWLLLLTLACVGRPGPVPREALPWEGAMVLLLALLLSPMSGPAHFGTQILAGFLLARSGGLGQRIAIVVAAISLLSAKDVVRVTVYDYALYYGHLTLGCLMLLVGCWWGRSRVATLSAIRPTEDEPLRHAA